MNAVEVVQRMRKVRRPGFLAAYLMLLLKGDPTRAKMGHFALRQLVKLANNFVSIEKIEVVYSDVLTASQIELGAQCLEALAGWELSEAERFQVRDDILAVKHALENDLPSLIDKQERAVLTKIEHLVNDLWKRAAEKPQESQST